MKILVTGAAGFIGSHLAERLAGVGHTVSGVDCLTDAYCRDFKLLNLRHIKERGVTHLPVDLAQDALDDAVAGIEVIYHLAAQPGLSDSVPRSAFVRNNVTATARLLDAAGRSQTLRGFVNVSSSSVYGVAVAGDETVCPAPASLYGDTKLAAEQLVFSHAGENGVPACSLRLFSVIGARERPEKLYTRLIGSIFEGREFPLHDGSLAHVRSYTDVDDIVDGLVAVMDKLGCCAGEVFNLGTDAATTTAEGIRTVERLMGKSAKMAIMPKRRGDQVSTRADIGKARRMLGFNPSVPLDVTLAKQIEWYERHIHGKVSPW
jgi:UDP-glucuronate 4-epimerase